MPTIFHANTPSPKGSTLGPLTCFAVKPDGVRFETQEEGETVILFLRQHIVVNVPWIIMAVIMIFAPTVLLPLFFSMIRLSVTIPVGYIVVGSIFWYVATFGFILAKFLGWFFNIYIVTNERLVDIDFYYLLYKHFSQAELTKVQDISYTAGGILSTIFNYGTVRVETAGEMPNLEFDMVPYPQRVVETIRSLIEQTEQNP